MAFEALSEKFQRIIKKIKGEARLSESNMDAMLKEIRIALLEADVNFKVVKEFLNAVKEKSLGEEVFTKLNPSEMVVKIVNDELVELLGSDQAEIKYNKNKPTIIMLVGLQGTGKTTSAAKLAYLMKNKLHKKVLLAALDIYRPGAIDQLAQHAKQINVDLFTLGDKVDPVEIAKKAKTEAYNSHYDVLILDTAGRLQIDEKLMDELKNIKDEVSPEEILLLVDAMAGQDAVNVAQSFDEKLNITGVILTKLDGDTRGGAALSIKAVTGKPIKFSGIGEKVGDLEPFYPDRMASRILGMGDVLTLIEKAQQAVDEKEMKKMEEKLRKNAFTLEDFLTQFEQIGKMGNLADLVSMIPGASKLKMGSIDEKQIVRYKAIIQSMTIAERQNPDIIKYSQRKRVAQGSGTTIQEVNQLLKQYEQSKLMMKNLNNNKLGRMLMGRKMPF